MMKVKMSHAEADRLKCLFPHSISPEATSRMEAIRIHYLSLGVAVLRSSLDSHSRSMALSYLEDAFLRAIQAIALEGQPVIPADVTVLIEPTWSMVTTP